MNLHAGLVKETMMALGLATVVIVVGATLAVAFLRRRLVG